MLKYIIIISFVALISLIMGFLNNLRENQVKDPKKTKNSFLEALKIIIILFIVLIIMWFILKLAISWIGAGFILFIIVFILLFK